MYLILRLRKLITFPNFLRNVFDVKALFSEGFLESVFIYRLDKFRLDELRDCEKIRLVFLR